MAVKNAYKPATTNAKDQSQNIALLLIAVFLVVIYCVKEFYLPERPSQITQVFPAEQTIVEIEDSNGVSKVYAYTDNENSPLPPGVDLKSISKGARGLNYSGAVIKSGTKIVINKDGSAETGMMSGEKHLIFSIPIDINKATAGDFEALPGIGPKLAEMIIETRERLGRFKTIDEIKIVKGIGDKKFDRIRDKVTVVD